VPDDATPAEIGRAYRRAAKRLHPDRAARDPAAQEEAHRRFLEVRRAYETLLREAAAR
jgi:DnaJ-class molecular chaperone